jgi:hypothetical protein
MRLIKDTRKFPFSQKDFSSLILPRLLFVLDRILFVRPSF